MKKAWFLALKEWKEILRDLYVLGILIFLPMITVGTLVMLISFYIGFFQHNLDKIQTLLENMPPAYLEGLSHYKDIQKVAVLPIRVIGLPFFLLLPLLISGIITSDSFAGERERNTLETLLVTPIKDWELLLGKILTPFVPALLVTWLSFAMLIMGLARTINAYFESPVFPDAIWILSMIFVVPLFIAGSILAEILISSRVASVKGASALNMFLTLPVLFLMLTQSSGFVLFSFETLPWMIVFLILVVAGLFYWGLKLFKRDVA